MERAEKALTIVRELVTILLMAALIFVLWRYVQMVEMFHAFLFAPTLRLM